MGRLPRDHPKKLAPKLRQLRTRLGLTQEEMSELLKKAKPSVRPGHISEIERGLREPTFAMVLRYARVAGISMETLVDDKMTLPIKLPGKKH